MNRWELLATTIANVGELDGALMEMVGNRQLALAKPVNSLGRLERLSIRLAGITGEMSPTLTPRTVIVCAGDHGITQEGISAFRPHATAQMIQNMLRGGSAANVLARQYQANVVVIDVGVDADLPSHALLRHEKIRRGTANFAHGQAMSRAEVVAAIEVGIRVATEEIANGSRMLLLGDLGVGNTAASSAIAALITELPVTQVTGMGSGIGLLGWRRKCEMIEHALHFHLPDVNDPIDVLSKVGGLEIAAIAGVIIAGAAARVPVVTDGLAVTAGAAIAAQLCVAAKSFMIAGHRSAEPGHAPLLDHLDLDPVVDLDITLGEGVGALLSIPVLEAAVATLNEMATFEEAQVSRPVTAELLSSYEPTFA